MNKPTNEQMESTPLTDGTEDLGQRVEVVERNLERDQLLREIIGCLESMDKEALERVSAYLRRGQLTPEIKDWLESRSLSEADWLEMIEGAFELGGFFQTVLSDGRRCGFQSQPIKAGTNEYEITYEFRSPHYPEDKSCIYANIGQYYDAENRPAAATVANYRPFPRDKQVKIVVVPYDGDRPLAPIEFTLPDDMPKVMGDRGQTTTYFFCCEVPLDPTVQKCKVIATVTDKTPEKPTSWEF